MRELDEILSSVRERGAWTSQDIAAVNCLRRRALADTARAMCPGYGACFCCGLPWPIVTSHQTRYGDGGHALFPLCQECWKECETPEARLPHYRALWEDWNRQIPDRDASDWPAIEAAVRAGL